MVLVIDCGLGNIGSVLNMLKKIRVEAKGSSSPSDVASADKLILPGVGAFDAGLAKLERSGMLPLLDQKVRMDKIPILGICLGMQLMADRSEEGERKGLGWIGGNVVRFRNDGGPSNIKVPHMCWNDIRLKRLHPLFTNLENEARFYFVHSYHLECQEAEVLATTFYGYEFVSAVAKGNIMGVQFHPEKSHKFGFQLLRNFAGM